MLDNEHITYKEGPTAQNIGTFYENDLSKRKLELNDTYTDTHNPIFHFLIKHIHRNKKYLAPPHTSLPHRTTQPSPPPLSPEHEVI
jgi:hypothetical protein